MVDKPPPVSVQLLIDTYSLFFRAYHALPPMSTSAGFPTNAVYGFTSVLIKLLREHAPSGIAFAIDVGETFRHREYPAYKAGRSAAPDALSAQFSSLRELLDALGCPVFGVPGFEADDVIATLARELEARGDAVLIASGDRDLLQLVRARVHVLFVGRRGGPMELYDQAAVVGRFGIAPEQLPSLTALVGDPADNIPKVPGIGARTGSALIAAHGNVEHLLDHLGDVRAARVREALERNANEIRLHASLARLRDDVELAGSSVRTQPLTHTALDRTRALLERLEFRSLLPRLDALRGLADASE
jgi:DNA polymerase-1